MLFKSQLITSASGSVGGLTASRNKGGMYFRARAVPTNPNSPQQALVRSILNFLSNRWSDVLTPTQRTSWETYAENVPVLNPLGDPIQITGLNHYIRSQVPALQAGATIVDTAPEEFNLGLFTAPTFSFDSPAQEMDVTFTITDDWVNEDNARMIVSLSRQQQPSINFFKGPYRIAGSIIGDSATPPTSPAVINAPFTAAVGNRVFAFVRVLRSDGRLSMPFRDFGVGV